MDAKVRKNPNKWYEHIKLEDAKIFIKNNIEKCRSFPEGKKEFRWI